MLGSRLTERDRQIAADCYEHHVLTTDQLRYLHFSSMTTTRERLRTLMGLKVLGCFRPPWQRGEGSTQHHWILGPAGAHVVAEWLGIEYRELRWRQSTAIALANSPKLRHHLEVNEFFARLANEAAAQGGALTEWYGERTTSQLFEGSIMPDGYAVVNLPAREPAHVVLELDRATEPAATLRDKAIRYAHAMPQSVLRHAQPLIVIAVPTAERAAAAASATENTGAPVAIAVWGKGRSALAIITRER